MRQRADYLEFLCITLAGFAALTEAYGPSTAQNVASDLKHRVSGLDLAGLLDVSVDQDREFIRLRGNFARPDSRNVDDLAEAALSALTVRPVYTDGHAFVVPIHIANGHAGTSTPKRVAATSMQRYRTDMEQAVAVHEAMAEGRLRLALQPVVQRSEPSQVLYHECLARIVHREGCIATLSAEDFVPALERQGLTRHFDRSVVRKCIDLLRANPDKRLGCNISALSARSDIWWSAILADLARMPDVAARLVIELTETAECADSEDAIVLLQAFRQLGCKVAIDDFGAGFSSIRFALMASPDIIKIDGSFVRQGHSSDADREILRGLIGLASAIATHVVVEGVEGDDELALADIVDAHWVQGYRVGRPELTEPTARRPIASLHQKRLKRPLAS